MSTKHTHINWAKIRRAVFDRDKHRCSNCLRTIDNALTLDPDHNVPRGVGGSNRLSNLTALCRQCHDAKHGQGVAPTIRWTSTGGMTTVEFCWYKHFSKQMIPAMARQVDIYTETSFGIDDAEAWHMPLGDVRRLDQQLTELDEEYTTLQAHEFM